MSVQKRKQTQSLTSDNQQPNQADSEDMRNPSDANFQPCVGHHEGGSDSSDEASQQQQQQEEQPVQIDTSTNNQQQEQPMQIDRSSSNQQQEEAVQIDTSTKYQQEINEQINTNQNQNERQDDISDTSSVSEITFFQNIVENQDILQIIDYIRQVFQSDLENLLDTTTYKQAQLNYTNMQKSTTNVHTNKNASMINYDKCIKKLKEIIDVNDNCLSQYVQQSTNNIFLIQMKKQSIKKVIELSCKNLQLSKEQTNLFIQRVILEECIIRYSIFFTQNENIQLTKEQLACLLEGLQLKLKDFQYAQNIMKNYGWINKIQLYQQTKTAFIKLEKLTLEIWKYQYVRKPTQEKIIQHIRLNDEQMFYMQGAKFARQQQLRMHKDLEKICLDKICGQCGKRLDMFNDKKQDFYIKIERDKPCRAEIYFSEFVDKLVFRDIDELPSFRELRVCYWCNKNTIQDSIRERKTPQPIELKVIKKSIEEVNIRLGHVYNMIMNESKISYHHLKGDTGYQLYNNSLGIFSKEFLKNKNWWVNFNHQQEQRISAAIKWLKENNHLYKEYYALYEVFRLIGRNRVVKALLDKSDERYEIYPDLDEKNIIVFDRESIKKDLGDAEVYIIPKNFNEVYSDIKQVLDLNDLRAFDVFKRNVDQELLDNLRKNDIKQKVQDKVTELHKNAVYYGNEFMEEMLFPTLFPEGFGGYNSSYIRQGKMTVTRYSNMKILSIRKEFGKHIPYIFFLFDRKRKEQMISETRGIKSAVPGQHKGPLTAGDITKQINERERTNYWASQLTHNFIGSPQYFIAQGFELDAMLQYGLKKYGKKCPDLLHTITHDENCQYLQRMKEQGQIMNDALLTCCSFNTKARHVMKAFIGNKSKQGIFGRAVMQFRRIEFQKRGPPHMHVLVWLDEEGTRKLEEGYLVQAVVPQVDLELKEKILKHYIHSCSDRCLDQKGKCKKGYPQPLSETDCITEDKYLYRRLTEQDRWVIPYNPQIVKMTDMNINVLRCTEGQVLAYLTKYVTKSEPGLDIKLNVNFEKEQQAQVIKFLKTNIISSCEAIYHILGLSLVEKKPQVINVYTTEPSKRMRLLKDDKVLKEMDKEDTNIYEDGPIEHYLDRPVQYEDLTYFDFREFYDYRLKESKVPPTIKNKKDHIKSSIRGCDKWYFKRTTEVILAKRKVYLDQGETYYYQKFLEKVPHRRNTEFSPNNIEKTYYVECILRDILDDGEPLTNEEIKAQFIVMNTNKIRLHGILMDLLRDNNTLIQQKVSLQQHLQVLTELLHEEKFDIQHIEEQLEKLDKKPQQIVDFLQEYQQGKDIEKYFINTYAFNPKIEPVLKIYFKTLIDQQNPLVCLGQDQRNILGRIHKIIEGQEEQCLMFITGGSGSGKSFLIKHLLIYFTYLLNKKCVLSATTGRAAANIDGVTLHSLFRVDESMKLKNFDPLSQLQIMLNSIEVLIIDEVSMMSEQLFTVINNSFQKAQLDPIQRTKLFGGKHIILVGDLMQLPVVEKKVQSTQDTNKSFINSYLFSNFIWVELTQNFRQNQDTKFFNLLNNMRLCQLTKEDYATLESINQQGKLQLNQFSKDSIVLVARNSQKDAINNQITRLKFKEEDANEILSLNFKQKNNVVQPIDYEQLEVLLENDKYAEKFKLPFKLILYKNQKIMINRNISIQHKITNGTMGTVIEFGPNNKYIKFYNHRMNEVQIIPMLQEAVMYQGIRYVRKQFPIQVAYASTVHKVQGETLNKIMINCDKMLIAGQFYTALSRAQKLQDVTLIKFTKHCINMSSYMLETQTKNLLRSKETKEEQEQTQVALNDLGYLLEQYVKIIPEETIKDIHKLIGKLDYKKLLSQDLVIDDNFNVKQVDDDIDFNNLNIFSSQSSQMSGISLVQQPIQQQQVMNPFVPNNTKLINNPFLNNAVQIRIPLQGAINAQRYPFIRWFDNSCLQDSLLHIFYFGIYNKTQAIKQNQVDQCLKPLVQSCIVLDTIPKNKEYPQSTIDYPFCQRQIQGVQPLRRLLGGRMCDFNDIEHFFKQSQHFKIVMNKRQWCSHMICQYDQTVVEEAASIELMHLVNNDVSQSVIGSLQEANLICIQCNQHTMTTEKSLLVAPEFLIVNNEMAEPVELTVNSNITFDLFDGTQVEYEIIGIIYYASRPGLMSIQNHFTSILKDGIHKDGDPMNGWWFYNGKLQNIPRNMHKAFDDSNNLNIGPDPPTNTLIPQVLFYNRRR